jgi:hypothetical protein
MRKYTGGRHCRMVFHGFERERHKKGASSYGESY